MKYSRDTIDEVLERLTAVDVLDFCGIHVDSATHNDVRCACPIHKGKDPNFALFYDQTHRKWRFKCFSHNCESNPGITNDLIGLTMAVKHLKFQDALEALAPIAGVELKEGSEDDTNYKERKRLADYRKQKAAAEKYKVTQLPRIKVTNKYDQGWDIVKQYLNSPARKSSLAEIEPFKLYPGLDYDRNLRLYIPLFDDEGRLVGLTGRMMDTVLKYEPAHRKDGRVKYPTKYDNTPGFKKSEILYNLNNAKNHTDQGLIVVEGQFDAIRMHNYGFPNTVAKMGPILSHKQIALLYRYTTSVVLLIEDCNKVDTETGKVLSIENLQKDLAKFKVGMKVSVAYLEKDPDSSTKEEVMLAMSNLEKVNIT